jgi:hypothetical protein
MMQNSPSSFFICGASRERINSEVLRPLIPLIHSHPDGGLCAYCNVSGCSDVGHGFNCFNYVCTESACGSQLSRMWGECASQATSRESLRVLEDVIYAHCGECCFSQPAMHHLRSFARMHVVHLHSETAQLCVCVKSGAHLVSVANCSVMHTTIMTTNAINR